MGGFDDDGVASFAGVVGDERGVELSWLVLWDPIVKNRLSGLENLGITEAVLNVETSELGASGGALMGGDSGPLESPSLSSSRFLLLILVTGG